MTLEEGMVHALCILFVFCIVFAGGPSFAGIINYLPGRSDRSPDMTVSVSTNKGASWRQTVLKPGHTFSWPSNATNLNVNGVPLDPKKNYRIKEGNIAEK